MHSEQSDLPNLDRLRLALTASPHLRASFALAPAGTARDLGLTYDEFVRAMDELGRHLGVRVTGLEACVDALLDALPGDQPPANPA